MIGYDKVKELEACEWRVFAKAVTNIDAFCYIYFFHPFGAC